MSMMTKVFVVLTAVLSIVASVLFISAASTWNQANAVAQAMEDERDALAAQVVNLQQSTTAERLMEEAARSELEMNLAMVRDEKEQLASRVNDLQTAMRRAENDKTAAEAGRAKLQEIVSVQTAQVKNLQDQNQDLLVKTTAQQSRLASLNARVRELTTNAMILTEQVRNLQSKNAAYEQKIASLEQRLEAGGRAAETAEVTAAPPTPTVAGPIRGEITAVEGDYASINIGQESGLVEGMVLMIYRGSTFMGELELSDVLPEEAGGRLDMEQGAIQVGDRVAYLPM